MSNTENYREKISELKKTGMVDHDQLSELENLVRIIESLEDGTYVMGDDRVTIKYVNTSNNEDPTWAKPGDSGLDLRAELTELAGGQYTFKPFERALIPTGLYFELPEGYEMQIRPRSGHSFKTGLMAILGTVDTGYRGEVKVIMINLSDKEQTITQGERIAQAVIGPRLSTDNGKLFKLTSVSELGETDRGTGGFGSTGKN